MCVVSDKSMGITVDKRRCFLWTNWMTMEEDLLPIVWPNDSIMAHHCCHRCHHHVSQNSCWESCLSHPLKVTQRVKARKEKEKDQKSWVGDWIQLPDSHFTWRILTNGWLSSVKIHNEKFIMILITMVKFRKISEKIKLHQRWIQERVLQ